MVFCNKVKGGENIETWNVTILILVDGFLQYQGITYIGNNEFVTILILVDGFLQSTHHKNNKFWETSQSLF